MAELTASGVACWVLKANPNTYDLRAALDDKHEIEGWTLHKTYRVDLMAPGKRCLLWLSGPRSSGVHAIGKIRESAEDDGQGGGDYWRDVAKQNRSSPVIAISVVAIVSPILRSELLKDPRFSEAEVIKMAAGSNPSYLTDGQLAAVLERLSAADLERAGW